MKEVLLSELEKKRLVDEELDPGQRRQNTYRIKQKLKAWAESAEDIIYALDHLSPKAAANVFDDKDVFRLLDIALAVAKKRDFAPVYKTKFGYIAIRNSIPIPPEAVFDPDKGVIHLKDKIEDWVRLSSEGELFRNQQLDVRVRQLLDLVLDNESMSLLNESRRRFPSEGIAEWRVKDLVDTRETVEEKLKTVEKISKIKRLGQDLGGEDS